MSAALCCGQGQLLRLFIQAPSADAAPPRGGVSSTQEEPQQAPLGGALDHAGSPTVGQDPPADHKAPRAALLKIRGDGCWEAGGLGGPSACVKAAKGFLLSDSLCSSEKTEKCRPRGGPLGCTQGGLPGPTAGTGGGSSGLLRCAGFGAGLPAWSWPRPLPSLLLPPTHSADLPVLRLPLPGLAALWSYTGCDGWETPSGRVARTPAWAAQKPSRIRPGSLRAPVNTLQGTGHIHLG